MKLVMPEAPALKAAVDAIVSLVEEGQFEVKKDGLHLKAMDPSQISMVAFALPKEAFLEYNLPEELKLGIDINQLSNVLARGKKGEKVELSTEEGLSMGGGQSLNFGLGNLETFAWVGGFSSAPNTKPPAELVPDPVAATRQLKLLYLSCGNKDGLMRISQGVHAYLKEMNVPQIWHVDDHAHDFQHRKKALYHFSQLIFR